MNTYKVIAEPDGRFWYLDISQIGRATQARTAREIPDMAKDLITIMTGEENPRIEVEYRLPEEARTAIHMEEERKRVDAEADAARRTAVRKLHQDGMSYRDIGVVLGISHQRAQQLAV